jgi:hypothetical protein
MQATDKGALWMLNVVVIAVPFCSAAVAFALAQDAYHASMCLMYAILHAGITFCVLAPFFEHQFETISRVTLCSASLEQLTERLKGVAAGVSVLQGSILSIALWACTPVGRVRSSLNPLANASSIMFEELLNDQFIRCVPINMGLLFIPVLATLLHASGSARILTNAKSLKALAIINTLFVFSSVFTVVPLGGIFVQFVNTAHNRTELTNMAPSTLLLWNIAVRNELTLLCCGILCGCVVAIVNVSRFAVKSAQSEALRSSSGGVEDDLYSYHLFLSHHQEHGQDQCKNLHTSLTRMGLKVWLDNEMNELSEEA